jgi:hypothetical protein
VFISASNMSAQLLLTEWAMGAIAKRKVVF